MRRRSYPGRRQARRPALLAGARGERPVDGVAVRLRRQRPARAQPGRQHPAAEREQEQRPPQQRVVGAGAGGGEEGEQVREPEPRRAGHAVDGAVGDQAAARGEHDELPEVGQEALVGSRAESGDRADERADRGDEGDRERRQAGVITISSRVARAAAAQHERHQHEARARARAAASGTTPWESAPKIQFAAARIAIADGDRGDHRADRRVAPDRRVERRAATAAARSRRARRRGKSSGSRRRGACDSSSSAPRAAAARTRAARTARRSGLRPPAAPAGRGRAAAPRTRRRQHVDAVRQLLVEPLLLERDARR